MDKTPLVIREADRFHIRLPNGVWHRHRSRQEAWDLLTDANLNGCKLLQSAIEPPKPVEIEYRPNGRHRWYANGVPMQRRYVESLLRDCGCDSQVIATILRAEQLIWQIKELIQGRLIHDKI
jgi:hypothetical protein